MEKPSPMHGAEGGGSSVATRNHLNYVLNNMFTNVYPDDVVKGEAIIGGEIRYPFEVLKLHSLDPKFRGRIISITRPSTKGPSITKNGLIPIEGVVHIARQREILLGLENSTHYTIINNGRELDVDRKAESCGEAAEMKPTDDELLSIIAALRHSEPISRAPSNEVKHRFYMKVLSSFMGDEIMLDDVLLAPTNGLGPLRMLRYNTTVKELAAADELGQVESDDGTDSEDFLADILGEYSDYGEPYATVIAYPSPREGQKLDDPTAATLITAGCESIYSLYRDISSGLKTIIKEKAYSDETLKLRDQEIIRLTQAIATARKLPLSRFEKFDPEPTDYFM